MATTIPASALTGLGQIDDRINTLNVPSEAFDPQGSWMQVYTILAGDGGTAHGRLSLTRQAKSPGATLLVDWRKGAGGPNHWRVSGTIRTSGPKVGDDFFWQSDSARHNGFYDAPATAVATTSLASDGQFEGGTVRIGKATRATVTELKNVDAALVGWQLFDLVQRLPRQSGLTQSFMLVDQFTLIKPKQSITYRGPVQTTIANGERTLHRFDLIGFATVPATFWVDDTTGRLVAAVSGLEAYVLGELPRGGGRERAGRAKKKGSDQY